ncbi:hypothetical protein NU219Hw_g1260t1 [Hortaea werneckii]
MDGDKELLLITAASGKQSSHLIPHILKQWKHIRLQRTWPPKPIATISWPESQPASSSPPASTPKKPSCGINMIDAALAQPAPHQPKHLLYSSVLHPHLRKLPNHDAKRYIEEHLIESVQPTTMIENLPLPQLLQQNSPIYPALWNPDTKFSFVSYRDIGESLRPHPLLPPPPRNNLAATYQTRQHPRPALLPRGPTDRLRAPRAGCPQKGLVGNANVLAWLLGRRPLEYEEWVGLCVRGG